MNPVRPAADGAALGGRRVILTGAAGGLGRTIAAALAARDAHLLLVDIDGEELHGLADRLQPLGAPVPEILCADIATAEGRAAVVAAAGRGGAADVLVNNAGVERASEFADLSLAEVRHAMEVNLLGAMLLSHELIPGMRERGRGHLISIASMAGVKPVPFNAVYNTSKAGLIAFSTSLSKELSGTGVHATVICPSAVREAGMWARVSRQLPRNRLVERSTIAPGDVAAAVLHALEHRQRRILVASPTVRAGALLSALSPAVDRATDRISGIRAIYQRRIETDRDNPL